MLAGQDTGVTARGFSSGQPVGTFGTLQPSDFKAVKVLQLLTFNAFSRLVVSLDDDTLADSFILSVEVEGLGVKVKSSEADFITRTGGLTTWGWDGWGNFVNTVQYNVEIRG